MDTLQLGIVTLLKSAVTQQPATMPEGFSLQEAMPLVRRHGLATLVYEGAVLCGFDPREPLMLRLLGAYGAMMLKSEGQLAAVERLCRAFDEQGIDYMLLKGCNMKALYPKPELRTMGDADILIRKAQYSRIVPIVQAQGYIEKVESDHEYVWSSEALLLELHKRVIPSYNRDFAACLGDGWQLARPGERGFVMEPEDEYLYLLTHLAKHYRDGGIGCRHVLDMWVYRRAHPELDEDRLREKLAQLRLEEFYDNLLHLLEVWFQGAEHTDATRLMNQFIFDSGSWGTAEAHILSAAVKNARQAGSLRGGKLRSLVRLVLPQARAMAPRYPILKKAPWLVPVVWPYRWVDAMLTRREMLRDIRASRKLETPEAVEGYRMGLNLVGLDFHFGKP